MRQFRISFSVTLGLLVASSSWPTEAFSQTARPTGPVGVNRPPTTAFRQRSGARAPLPGKVRADDGLDGEALEAEIVARVDDEVILLAEVLQPVRAALELEKQRRTAEEYRQIEWDILHKVTQSLIERTVLINELKLRVPDPAVLENIKRQIEEEFEKYLDTLVVKNQFESREALLEQLTKEGMTLARLREDYIKRTMAEQFLNQLVRPQVTEPTRDQLWRYYETHLEEFTEEAGAVWSHIQVQFGADKEEAKRKVLAALGELQKGEEFAKVARKYSDGPTAIDGGVWPLTSPGSYADAVVDKAIFALPVGEISKALIGKDAYHIVRVDKRNDGSPTPFAEVQSKIKLILKNQGIGELRQAKLQEIMARHYIESIFDEGKTDLSQAGEKSKLLR